MILPGLWALLDIRSVQLGKGRLEWPGLWGRCLCEHSGFVFPQISWLLQVSLGTTPAETLSVAGNIFVGQVRLVAGDPAPKQLLMAVECPAEKGYSPPFLGDPQSCMVPAEAFLSHRPKPRCSSAHTWQT